MTDQPTTPQPASRLNDSRYRANPHNPAAIAERSSPTRREINNFSTHLGITIRWIQEPGQTRHDHLILRSGKIDLGVVIG